MDRILTFSQALREATEQEMARDPRVFVFGQGIDDHKGMYGTTAGLVEKFGADRCFDTPLSEDAMTGAAVGAALAGMRPIHTHIRMDFILLAMNQIINIAAKTRYTFGGQVNVPIVLRSVIGRSWGQGAQHSQGLHALFMHIPGLRVAAPTTPYDAKGCLITSIRDDNPVIFVEHRMLHFQKGHVPAEPYESKLGLARVLRPGKDVTMVGVLHAAVECLRSADELAKQGVEAEVIDPVWLSPLDVDSIAASVKKTGRLLVVDSAHVFGGASAEIVAGVAEKLGGSTSFRFKRMGFAATVCPTSKSLENLFYPSAKDIASAAYALVHGDDHPWTPDHVDAPEVLQFKGPF